MSVGADHGVGMGQPEREKPVDIRTAYELWCAVAVLGLLGSIALVFVTLGDREAYTKELTRRLEEMNAADDAINLTLAFNLGLGVAALLGVAIAAGVFLLARQLRAGKGWARLLLTGATAFVVVSAIGSFGGEGQSGIATLALGAIIILQAVLAVGATVLAHRRDASLYLAKRPRP